jgi:hypothetical protein
MDYALYRVDMVGVLMARLKYNSLDIFLTYFDHSIRIPCVSMDAYSKNHVEIGKFVTFPYLPKIYLWPFQGYMHKGPLKYLTVRCI